MCMESINFEYIGPFAQMDVSVQSHLTVLGFISDIFYIHAVCSSFKDISVLSCFLCSYKLRINSSATCMFSSLPICPQSTENHKETSPPCGHFGELKRPLLKQNDPPTQLNECNIRGKVIEFSHSPIYTVCFVFTSIDQNLINACY